MHSTVIQFDKYENGEYDEMDRYNTSDMTCDHHFHYSSTSVIDLTSQRTYDTYHESMVL